MKRKKTISNIIYHVLVCAFGLVMIYPLVWMVMSSFKDTNTIFTTATSLIPEKFTLQNYVNGWKGFAKVGFGTFFKNSLFISITATIGTVLSSSVVAYGFARCKFPGRKLLFAAMLASMMLPAQVLMIPQYLWYQKLNWVGTNLPLIVPYCFAIQGFFVYMMTNFIEGIPRELDEAAKIDGASKLQQIWYVSLPMIKPIIIVMMILSVGNMMRGDFGLFFNTTMNSPLLYKTTDVIDTYVYRSLMNVSDIGMASTTGFIQAVVGFFLVLGTNLVVKKIEPDSALF